MGALKAIAVARKGEGRAKTENAERLLLGHLPKLREMVIVEKGIRGVEGSVWRGASLRGHGGLRERLERPLQVEELERLRFASLVKRF
jgi:hypothetical protein